MRASMRGSVTRHPSYLVVATAIREECRVEQIVGEETAVLLLQEGLEGAAERKGRSERTIRRRFEERGVRVSDFVERIRVRVTGEVLRQGLPLSIVARWLGFGSAATYRHFIQRRLGLGVRGLRRRLRERAPSDEAAPASEDGRPATGTPGRRSRPLPPNAADAPGDCEAGREEEQARHPGGG